MAWHTGVGMGWWMLFGGSLWIIFWGTVIYLVVSLTRSPQPERREPHEEPIDVAKRRYASGEITRDEYEQVRHDLVA